ncbi:SOS response-associated peptidase family protein [Burkholderia vietnamiensis]|uniref:SOS response-associated peptidase family protein n=1 Tax=Burkholderia vietnamiensis TaxID=60552 RepID=UPI001B9E473A|nr:SOS response-associated peptidase family protein [Burkholderia vietnamiensis]MBR7920202.1 SOS response-associated peptidase family protein [Burkholderia vietnamiensis]
MCTTYRAPNEDPGINELKIGIGDLFHRDPWPLDVWPDYPAPVVLPDGDDAMVVEGVYGFWPKFMQPEKTLPNGKKLPKFSTYNSLGEEVSIKPTFKKAWADGHRCLIPAAYVLEPSYPNATLDAKGKWIKGPCVWQKIGVADGSTYCVAGIWKRYPDRDGRPLIGVSMLTLNADNHPLMKQMHGPEDEKRSIVILRPADYDEWLHTKNVEAARAIMQLLPAEEMRAEPTESPKRAKAKTA